MRAAFLVVGLSLAAGNAAAIDLETLVMPGPVIEGHAKIEAECSKCHQPFQKEAENALCLDCHDEVKADVERKLGFHGRAPAALGSDCRTCHSDHKGREADVLSLDPDAFDHDLSDYPLHGAHVGVPCQSCHAPDTPHREASSDCIACHESDDRHKGRLGTECLDCHTENAWKEWRFDHDLTDFPLEGGHQDVACGLCHPSERYENTPADCVSCHALDDVHRSGFGNECASCHGVDDWKSAAFDHDRDTDFALEGSHATVECSACHGDDVHAEIPSDCLSCHRADDDHRGRFGPRCESCHGVADWTPASFDHDRDTKWPLRGAHDKVSCETCHPGVLYEERTPSDCLTCHADDDVHKGQQGKDCATCHSESTWEGEVRFDHDLTAFPLLGLHAVVACEECHATPAYKDAEVACASCHADEFHATRLGVECAVCHNPNGWKVWRFDHDTQSSFALHGAHLGVDCHSCHSQPVTGEIALPETCVDCHRKEDVHDGAFGSDCQRCHTDQQWSEVKLDP